MKKILIIEDDKTLRTFTSEILTLAGFYVIVAENGKEGIEIAKENKPDLIICDIMMPEIDGFGVQKILSMDSSFGNVPFIFLTGKSNQDDIRKGMNSGADDYLIKPVSKNDLLDSVEGRFKKVSSLKSYFEVKNFGDDNGDQQERLESLFDLISKGSDLKYKKKSTIYQQGDNPDHLYFVKSGKVRLSRSNEEGKEFSTQIVTGDSFLGYKAIIENKALNETATVIEEAVIVSLSREKFLTILSRNRKVSIEFIKILNAQNENNEGRLLSMAFDSVRKRTANVLFDLYEKYQTPKNQE